MAIIDTIRSDGYDMASWMWISFECLVIYDRPLLYKQRGAFYSLNRNQWTIASLCATGNGTASHSFSFFNLLSLAFVRMTRPYCSIDLLWQVLLLFFIQIYMLHIRSSFLFLFRLFGLESYLGQRGGCGLVGWRYVFFFMGIPAVGIIITNVTDYSKTSPIWSNKSTKIVLDFFCGDSIYKRRWRVISNGSFKPSQVHSNESK